MFGFVKLFFFVSDRLSDSEFCTYYTLFIYLDVEGAGRGAVAVEDLEIGDTALEIPVSIIICEELVYESDMVCIK